MRITVIIISILLCVSCATHVVNYNSKKCTIAATCGPTADCAALLYNKASAIMSEAEQHHKNELFILASTKYNEALHLLRCADKKLAEAQLKDFDDWKTANIFGLGNRIKEAIAKCDRLARNCKWKM